MNKQCLYFLVIFSFLLPISPRCSFDHAPMNGICTPCGESGCAECYGDPNYCTNCNQTSLIRGKCHPCDDVNCEFCYLTHSERLNKHSHQLDSHQQNSFLNLMG